MSRGTILLVDDSPLTLEAVRRALEARDLTVRTACDLAEVPATVRRGGLDLVLLDVEMAEAFGDDLAIALRSGGHAAGDGPPIYLLSAIAEDELADRAADAGVEGFISKQGGVDGVVRQVEAVLGAAPVGDAVAAPVADLAGRLVDTAGRRLRHAGAALARGGRDDLRQVAYELHALVGEAAVVGFPALAALAGEGHRAVIRALDGDASGFAACAAALDRLIAELPAATRAAAAPAPAIRPGAGRRIFLIDDSELYRVTLRAVLEDAGHQVSEASSVAEARDRLGEVAYDLAVVDLELGDGSGTELIPALRAAQPAAAVVVLTGGDQLTVPPDADLTLLKTLDPTTLLVKLERTLAGS